MSFLIKALQDISWLTTAFLPSHHGYEAHLKYELGLLVSKEPEMKMKAQKIASKLAEKPSQDLTASMPMSPMKNGEPIDRKMSEIWQSILSNPLKGVKQGRWVKCLYSSTESLGILGFSLPRSAVLGLNGPAIVTVVVLTPMVCFLLSSLLQHTRFTPTCEQLFSWGNDMQYVSWIVMTGLFVAQIYRIPRVITVIKQIGVIAGTSFIFRKIITTIVHKKELDQIKEWKKEDKNRSWNFQMIPSYTKRTTYRDLVTQIHYLIEEEEKKRVSTSHNMDVSINKFKENMNGILHIKDYVLVTNYLRQLESLG